MKFVAVNFKETDEKCGENLVNFFFDFRPSISREIGRKKFHTNSSTHQDLKFHTAEQIFFHSDALGVDGPNLWGIHYVLQLQFWPPTLPHGHKDRVATLGISCGPPQTPPEPRGDPADPRRDPRREPSERQISSESLAEGCAPRMVTLQNFRIAVP